MRHYTLMAVPYIRVSIAVYDFESCMDINIPS